MSGGSKQAGGQFPLSDDLQERDSEWVDALLRQDAMASAGAIPDDGFTEALMRALPPRRERARESHHWIVPAMGFLGFVVGLVMLSGGEELSLLLAGLAQTRVLSLQSLLLAVLPLGVLYWIALSAAWQET